MTGGHWHAVCRTGRCGCGIYAQMRRRVWCNAQARLLLLSDEQGLVFCIAADSGIVKLYDVRSYDKGPFDTFTVRHAFSYATLLDTAVEPEATESGLDPPRS